MQSERDGSNVEGALKKRAERERVGGWVVFMNILQL
jgi:hypothetical protein